MKITLKQLRQINACRDQQKEFRKRFGNSVEVTKEGALAVAQVFKWQWAAPRLLPPTAYRIFEKAEIYAWNEYARKMPKLRSIYLEKELNASRDFKLGRLTLAEYEEKKIKALKIYIRAEDAIIRRRNERLAIAFAIASKQGKSK